MSVSARLLLKNTPENVLVIPFANSRDCQEIIAQIESNHSVDAFTIWLTDIEQIHRFVGRIPNLAWELMDYAEEPLTIVYAQAKPLFPDEKAPDEICVRLLNQEVLRKTLPNRQPWLAVDTQALPADFSYADWIDKEVDLRSRIKLPRPVKIMRVMDNDEFSFLT